MTTGLTTDQATGITRGRVAVDAGVHLWTEAAGGPGPAVLAIGGVGSGAFADAPVAALLARRLRLISFDRRATGRSTGGGGIDLDPAQAAADARAVLAAHEVDEVVVFGTCAGAAIAIELTTAAPGLVSGLVIHEPLLLGLLPAAETEFERYFGYRDLGRRHGPATAMGAFLHEHGLPYPDRFRTTFSRDGTQSLEHELEPLIRYRPHVDALRTRGNRITILAGRTSVAEGRAYARSATELARLLSVPVTLIPGHHSAYFATPDEFADAVENHLARAHRTLR